MCETDATYPFAEVGVMECFEKSKLTLKTQTIVRKFEKFEFAGRLKKNGAFPVELVQNCDLSDGNARVGVGASIYTLPSGKGVVYDWNLSAPKKFFYCGDKLGFLSDENKLYFYEEATRSYRLTYTFYGKMKPIQAQDDSGAYHLYFCGEMGVFSYNHNEGVTQISQLGCLPVACTFQGRIFTAAGDSIVYSAPFSEGNMSASIDGGGKIVLPSDTGEVVDITATSDSVFVFCERGIWKLAAAGSARDFRLERVGFTGSGILKGSACPVAYSGGEKVFFFDKYGPWKLERLGAVRICRDLTFPIRPVEQECEHAYLSGQVVCNYRALDNSVRNVVIDAETDKAYHSFTAQGLSNLNGQAVGAESGFLYALKSESNLPTYRLSELVSPEYDFEISGVKTLRRLQLYGDGTFTLTVSNGRKTKTFSIQTENGFTSVDVRLKGEFFRLRLVFGEQAILRGLDAELCKLAGVR